MPENILVIEYEPRYTERVQKALAGQTISALFAKDGEEAIRALDSCDPSLIVLSSVVPKISAPELIRTIRGRGPTQQTPILLTVSGYSGNAPKQDAVRMGASDILPKPYSESEFLGKVQQMLGMGQMTSKQIFGDLLNDETQLDATVTDPGAKKPMKPKSDVDKMLEQTLADVMPKKKDGAARQKTMPGTSELDKKLQDTLSGLEKSIRRTAPGTTPVPKIEPSPAVAPAAAPVPTPAPAAAPAAAPAPAAVAVPPASAPPAAAPVPHLVDKVPVSQPVIPAAAPAPAPAPKEEEPEPTDGVRFGQYVLQEKIATGGMAEVWKARMRGVEGFQKTVAIKKILPHLSEDQEFIEMFVDEAKLAAQLNHNNIIHIYDLGKIASSYYIAMEYVDGHDLKSIVKRAKERSLPMTVEVALFIGSKVASALDYAHRKRDFDEKEMGLVHRDVSPQNVLISEEGDIKLCDFGIAKAASKASHTQAGALKGKLQYMSPEQASAQAIDRRSDIFALAAVMFEMLTGRKLFTGDNEISILDQVREARVTPPSQINDEVTPQIDRIILKALQKDPAARYQTAGEMARDIDAILYSFKPTPTAADLAIYMHHLWSAETIVPRIEEPETIVMETVPDLAKSAPKIVPLRTIPAATLPATTAPGNVVMPAWEAGPRAPEKKGFPVLPVGIAAAVVVLAGGGYFFFMRNRTAAPAPVLTPKVTAAAPVAPPRTNTATAQSTTSAAAVPATSATQEMPPALDPNAINAEVQKRLAAERARLDEQQRRQAQQQQPAAARQPVLNGGSVAAPAIAPRTTSTQPVQQATQTSAPAQTQTQAPAPPPTQTVAAQPAADTAPAPPRVQPGDLVATGTPGLIPGRLLQRGAVPYPPIARQQRIQGTVLVNVLVSETGRVLDVKILHSQPAGLDEAAIQIVRRSTFSAPTKDGVRVKAWTTVPVDFKL